MFLDMNSRQGRSIVNFTPNADTTTLNALKTAMRFNGGTMEYLIKPKDKSAVGTLIKFSFGVIAPREGIVLLSCNPQLYTMASVSAPTFYVAKETQNVEILVRTFEEFDVSKLEWMIQLTA